MTITNHYGFESTDNVQYDKQGLPVGTYKVLIKSEDPSDNGFILDYEILDGNHKGKGGKQWYNTLHANPTTANIAKQSVKRIADATARAVSPTSPLKGRVLTIEVREQKKDNRYTEIVRYLPENHAPTLDAPF